jgi:Cu-processing system ATP-binding protein
MADVLIHVNELEKKFGSLAALQNVSFELSEGQMLALLGHNGAGKTTLMKTILGLETADNGIVEVFGLPAGRANYRIGYVPENVSFYPALTGYETLQYFARLNGLSRAVAKDTVNRLLTRVHLANAARRPVKHYSKGMKQRLGLAQALLPSSLGKAKVYDPKLLILDEPTVGLDPVATLEFFDMLAELKQQGCGIVICTHVLPGLEQYLDRALILNQGRVVVQGSITELHEQARLPVKVTPKGLNGSLSQDPELQPYLQQNGLLSVPAEKALGIASRLLSKDALNDLQITAPSLPELYQYFMQPTVSAIKVEATYEQ